MNATQARNNLKEFMDSLTALLEIAKVLEGGEAKLDLVLSRHKELDRQTAEKSQALNDITALYSNSETKLKAKHKELSEGLDKDIQDKTAKLQDLLRDLSATKAGRETALKQETAHLMAERRMEIARLDREIEDKEKRLRADEEAIEDRRRRLA